MPAPERRTTSPRQTNTRERIAAKRAARRRRSFPLPVVLIGVVGIIAIALLGGLLLNFRSTLGAIQQRDPRQQVAAQTVRPANNQAPIAGNGSLNAPFNVVLIGVDKRSAPDEGIRSDTLIVVHVDPQQKTAAMLSIPRDSIVTIPNFGQSKINAAYTNGYNNAAQLYGPNTDPDAGGGALVAQTVEQMLGITVDYVAQVDFNGFAEVVDALGGVVVDVERPLLDAEYPTDDYGVERIYIPAGLQVMDGRTALIYARSRHSGDDFGRSKRQQQVLRAMLSQVKARGLLENVASLNEWTALLTKNVRTTLPLQDPSALASLATLARELTPDRITQLSISPDTVQVTLDGSDLYWNQADLNALVTRWQNGTAPTATTSAVSTNGGTTVATETAQVQILNATGTDGVATKMSTWLSAQGYSLADPATAIQTVPNTLVIDYTGKPEVRARLAATMGIDERFVQPSPEVGAPPQGPADIVVLVGQDYKQTWLGQ